jgi:hypothetical protein
LEQATRNNYISQYHRELPYAAEFQPSCILHTLGPCLFVYSFNCSYAEGFLVVFDHYLPIKTGRWRNIDTFSQFCGSDYFFKIMNKQEYDELNLIIQLRCHIG